MLNWKKIEDFNLKDVASKTQIEIEFLDYLVKKDFENLSRFNVKGFTKILSREYDLDFSEFYEEYDNYIKDNNVCSEKKCKTLTKLDCYSKESTNLWLLAFILFLFVGLGFGIYYYDYLRDFLKEKDVNTSVAVVEIIDKAQDNLDDLKAKVVIIEENNTSNELNNSDINLSINFENENNITDIKIEEQNITLEQNQTQTLDDKFTKEVIFSPKNKIWIGIIDLKTNKKTNFVKDKNFSISLQDDKLILTGSPELSMIDEKGEVNVFKSGYPKRFLIKDGKIKSIKSSEFMKYNKGKEW